MTNRLELNWKLDGFVDEQRYYCSETPIDIESLPTPKAVLVGDVRNYVDYVGDFGKKYYIRVGAVKDTVEKISEEIEVVFGNAWSPENLTNPANLWLSAENVIKDSYGRISQLTDMSGNGFHFSQTSNSNKPILFMDITLDNDVVRFDGVDDFLSVTSSNAAKLFRDVRSAFIFCIVKGRSATGGGGIFYAPRGGSGASRINLGMQSNIIQFSTRRLDSEPTDTLVSSVASDSYQIVSAIVDYHSGIKRIYSNSVLSENSVTIGNTSDTDGHNQTIRIGVASTSDTGGALDMDITDIIVISNSIVSDTDRLKLEGWAAHKYGLTDNLPIDHPYKTLIPII